MEELYSNNRKIRRSKLENYSRPFECGCGKNYLSYAALYTHIKSKHDGISPEGSYTSQTNLKRGRGRPKKSPTGASIPIVQVEIIDLLLQELGFRGKTTAKEVEHIFHGKAEKIYEKLKVWQGRNPRGTAVQLTCDDVFGLYFIEIAENVSPLGYELSLQVLDSFRTFINKMNEEIGPEPTAFLRSLELPMMCNDFIMFHVDQGETLERETAVLMSLVFCQWLVIRGYSFYQLSLLDYTQASLNS